jgi:hypothetical protein
VVFKIAVVTSIPGKLRDFVPLQKARLKGQEMHDLVFDSEQGKEIDKLENGQTRF